MKISRLPQSRATLRGFSLVELLVVILIITIVMTAGVIGVRNVTAGRGTATAVASVEALFAEARGVAIGRGTDARVLVDVNDSANMENYLRRVVVAYKDQDGDRWVLTGRAYQIPSGAYFSQTFSEPSSPSGQVILYSEAGAEMSGYSGDWAAYDFNSQGIFQSTSTDPAKPPGSFIVGAGQRSGGSDPRVTGVASRDFAGFVIWRNGQTSAYQSPAQMDLPGGSEPFSF